MASVERTVTVAQPVETVWAYLSDFTTTERWDPPTVTTRRTSGDGGVGTTYRNVSRLLGRTTEVTYEVVRFEPHRVFELSGRASRLDLHDTITFAARDGHTAVTYRSVFRPRGVARLAEPLLALGLQVLGSKVAASLEDELAGL
jgi:uncharacterized protein YndB with AHSA1/START domain